MAFYNNIWEQIKKGDGIAFSTDPIDGRLIISLSSNNGLGILSITSDPKQLAITGNNDLTINISQDYVGQSSITKLGTIDTGIWDAGNITTPQVSFRASGFILHSSNLKEKKVEDNPLPIITIKAPTLIASQTTYTLPANAGTANQALTLFNNTGTMIWKNFSLSSLTDCKTTTANNEQLLVYNKNNTAWTPYTLTGTGFVFDDTKNTINLLATNALSGLISDVLINKATLVDKQILTYSNNATTASWINSTISLASGHLSDVVIDTPTLLPNSILQYIGNKWINSNNLVLSGILSFKNTSSSNVISIQTPNNITTNSTYTLPQSVGTLGEVLGISTVVNGSASLDWLPSSASKLSSLTDCTGILTATNRQLLVYSTLNLSNKWTPFTLRGNNLTFDDIAKTITTVDTNQLSLLTDCSGISSATNHQLLLFTTLNSLNKWTPYALSGATFNDVTKTITVAATGGVTEVKGFSGQIDVANGTTIPLISISSGYIGQTTITTLGTISGTAKWNATPITVGFGGTGLSATTPYSLLAGGTTATGSLQSLSIGTIKQLLTAGTTSSLPNWTTVSLKDGFISDVVLTPPIATNQVIQYDGSKWVNATINTGGGGTTAAGTPDRITVTNTNPQIIDIAGTYVGQTSITTLGTISSPSAVWNAGNVTTPQIAVTSNNNTISLAAPAHLNLSSSYTLPSAPGTTGQVLSVLSSSSSNNISNNTLVWANTSDSNAANSSTIAFIDFKMFNEDNIYTIPAQPYYGYIVNKNDPSASSTKSFVFSALSGNGTQSFYMKIVSNSPFFNLSATFPFNYICLENGTFASSILFSNSATYLFTYYDSTPPAPFANKYPCYTATLLPPAKNMIPLEDKMKYYIFRTHLYSPIIADVSAPNLQNGQEFWFLDQDGYMYNTSITLRAGSGNAYVIDNQTSKTFTATEVFFYTGDDNYYGKITSLFGNLVRNISGTLDQIDVSPSTAPIVSISKTYKGQGTIQTLGAIKTGTWNSDIIGSAFGGTGSNNGTNTITIAGNLSIAGAHTISGVYPSVFTMTGPTSVTFPTSGTLATTSQIPSFPVPVGSGGTGKSAVTPNALLAGGTTSTGTLNIIATGGSKQLLTTETSGSLPTWASVSLSGNYINDVKISNPSAGQIISHNGTNWANTAKSASNSTSQVRFINKTHFNPNSIGNILEYYIQPTTDMIIMDTSGFTVTPFIYVPTTLTGNGIKTIYIQIVGATSSLPVLFPPYPCYLYDSTNNLVNQLILLPGSTYALTYYQNGGLPVQTPLYPAYTSTTVNIPYLKNNTDAYVIYANSYRAINANLGLPPIVSYGYIFRLKVVNEDLALNKISVQSITLCNTSGNNIEGIDLKGYPTDSLSKQFIYLGSGTNGIFYTL